MLPLNEAFHTIQGEGFFTGTPATFLRLQHCAVGCPFCDTKHTWRLDKDRERPLTAVLSKTDDDDTYAWASERELVLVAGDAPLVVITGGEPCDYDLYELTRQLLWAGAKRVQIETSGTSPVNVCDRTWVTLSPKIGMPGGKVVLSSVVARCNEIKMPVGKPADVNKLKEFIKTFQPSTDLIWLQPLSCSPKATELCIEAARANGWRLSAQLHKYIGVR